jgi:hypothetical protein
VQCLIPQSLPSGGMYAVFCASARLLTNTPAYPSLGQPIGSSETSSTQPVGQPRWYMDEDEDDVMFPEVSHEDKGKARARDSSPLGEHSHPPPKIGQSALACSGSERLSSC